MRIIMSASVLLAATLVVNPTWASATPPASASELAQLAANLRGDVPALNQIASLRSQDGSNYQIPQETRSRFNSDAARSDRLGNAFQHWTDTLDSTASQAWFQCIGSLSGAPGNFQIDLQNWMKGDEAGFIETIAGDAQNEANWWQTYAQCLGAPQQADAEEQQERAQQAEADRQARLEQQREQRQAELDQQRQQQQAQAEQQREMQQQAYQQQLDQIQQTQNNINNAIDNTVNAILQQHQAQEQADDQPTDQDEQPQTPDDDSSLPPQDDDTDPPLNLQP